MKLEQSFMDFMLHHQQRHNRSYKFLVLMEALQAAAKYIQYYYQTGSLKNLMGEAGFTNVQGENVLKMDDIADSIVLHYLQRSEQVIRAVTEEEAEPVVMNEETGRYFVYYDPLDGSSNVKHNLPVGFMFAIGKRNLEGPEDNHLRKGSELRAAGIYLIPNGVFTLALADTGVFRFHRSGDAISNPAPPTIGRMTSLLTPPSGKQPYSRCTASGKMWPLPSNGRTCSAKCGCAAPPI